MLISVHIPKTAGTSFRHSLTEYYGDKLMTKYGEGPFDKSSFDRNKIALKDAFLNLEKDYEGIECIHGHFLPVQYLLLDHIKPLTFVTWLRNPVDRIISNYYHLQRHCNDKYSEFNKTVISEKWSLEKYCFSAERRNMQSNYLWGFPIECFDFIGITEFYEEDFRYFSHEFLSPDLLPQRQNVNPDSSGMYPISKSLRKEIEAKHEKDMALYQKALKMREMRLKNFQDNKSSGQSDKIRIGTSPVINGNKNEVLQKQEENPGSVENTMDPLQSSFQSTNKLAKNNEKNDVTPEKRIEQIQRELDTQHNSAFKRIFNNLKTILNPTKFVRIFRQMREDRRFVKNTRLIEKSGLFDATYYLENNPDVKDSGMSAINHYLIFGGFEGRNPSKEFNCSFYLEKYTDVRRSSLNPLVHFIKHGRTEGRLSQPEKEDLSTSEQSAVEDSPISFPEENDYYWLNYRNGFESSLSVKGKEYVDESESLPVSGEHKVKLITFYLPQFHPIPENDQWWGKGFTEWTNVGKSIPQFVGHYQPRLPGELGFYDLRVPEIMKRQIELARKYGIYGFCFHYYWFEGKRLLEKPLNQLLNDPEMDFPFCICWANENWTRRWDGGNDEILIAQEHNFENDKHFIEDLVPVLRDPRYIKLNGRPLIIVYRPTLFEQPNETTGYWKQFCIEKNLGEPIIIGAQTFGFSDPTTLGLDAAVEFPPHNKIYNRIHEKIQMLNPKYAGDIYDYKEMVLNGIALRDDNFRVFKTVNPSWDNEARMPGRGNSFAFATPGLYRRWLEEVALQELRCQKKDERFIFINAWNEWGEGAYLEPDQKFGYACLQATNEALQTIDQIGLYTIDGAKTINPQKKYNTAVIFHVFYPGLFHQIADSLNNIEEGFDLFVSLPDSLSDFRKVIFEAYPQSYVLITENRGRDIAPFIEIYRLTHHLEYEYFLKIYTKKPALLSDGDLSGEDMLRKLLGNRHNIQAVLNAFMQEYSVGIIGPKNYVVSKNQGWGFVKDLTLQLARDVGSWISDDFHFEFIEGSMFWAKPQVFSFLKLLPVHLNDFEPEPILSDGTLADTIERLIGLVASASGYLIKEIDEFGAVGYSDKKIN